MQAIRACVAATVRRDLKEPVAPVERSHEERITFRWRRFLLLTYLVVTASTAQLCLMTQGEIRERNPREAQEIRNRLHSANQEPQVAGTKSKTPQPETFTHSDTSNHRSRSGTIQTTTNGRLGNADFGLSALHRTESVSRECMPGMDDVSVMRSTLESKDGPGRHSGEDGADNRTTSVDTTLSRMCLDDATNKTETFFGCSRFPHCKRVIFTSRTAESRVSPSAHSCSAAQPTAEQVMVLDSDSVGSEESFRMLNVPAVPAVSRQEQQFLLEQLRHLSSSGITGQEARRAIVRMFPDQQQKVKVSKAARNLQDTMQKI